MLPPKTSMVSSAITAACPCRGDGHDPFAAISRHAGAADAASSSHSAIFPGGDLPRGADRSAGAPPSDRAAKHERFSAAAARPHPRSAAVRACGMRAHAPAGMVPLLAAMPIAMSEPRVTFGGTICSVLPSACDGSFTGPKLGRQELPNGGSIELSGTLPTELAQLHDLEEIALAAYDISGTFPPEFANFNHLRTIYLDNNAFSGTISDKYFQVPHPTDGP